MEIEQVTQQPEHINQEEKIVEEKQIDNQQPSVIVEKEQQEQKEMRTNEINDEQEKQQQQKKKKQAKNLQQQKDKQKQKNKHKQSMEGKLPQKVDPLTATAEDKELELKVCKFLDLQPSTILCMKAHPFKKYMLVGRNDGTIEIWNLKTNVVLMQIQLEQFIIPQRLAWLSTNLVSPSDDLEYLCEDEFLYQFLVFSQNGTILLYSLNSTLELHWFQTQSRIWDASIQNGIFMTAHEDGTVRQFFVDDKCKIRLKNSSSAYTSRCVSVCWDLANSDGSFYASYYDGTIKNYTKSFSVKQTIKCEKNTFAWQLVHRKNQILIAGCNEGSVLFFETKFGTLLKSFKKHEADILQITVHPTFPKLYCTGSDSKIAVFDIATQQIQFLQEFRGQSHDIFALDFIGDDILASGGYTTDICLYYMQQGVFKTKKHLIGLQSIENKIAYNFSQQLVSAQKASEFQIYQMDSQNFQLNIQVNTKNNIVSSFFVGDFCGYTTNQETFVFKLDSKVTLKKVFYKQEGFKLITFSQLHRQLIFINQNNQIGKIFIPNNIQQQQLNQQREQIQIIADLEQSLYNAQNMVLGPNEKSLIVGSKVNSTIVEYSLTEENKILYKIPNMFEKDETSFTVLKYFKSTNQLVIVYENKKFVIIDMFERQLSKYSRENMQKFPSSLLKNSIPILNVIQHPKIKKRLIFTSIYYFFVVDLSVPFKFRFVSNKNNSNNINNNNQNIIDEQSKQDEGKDMDVEEENQQKSYQNKRFQPSCELVEIQKPMVAVRQHLKQLVVFETDFTSMISNLAQPVVSKKFNV